MDETGQPSQYPSPSSDYAYVPSSPFEVFLVVMLSLPSIAFIVSEGAGIRTILIRVP